MAERLCIVAYFYFPSLWTRKNKLMASMYTIIRRQVQEKIGESFRQHPLTGSIENCRKEKYATATTLQKGIYKVDEDPSFGSSTTGEPSIVTTVDQKLTQNPEQSETLRLYVRLPTQKTVTLDISRNCQTIAELKRTICDKMDMPDTESIVLSHQGKSIATNFDKNLQESASKYHLATVQISLALPGGATVRSEVNGNLGDDKSTPDRASSSLRQFLKYVSNCLTLTDPEIKTLANSMNYRQIDTLDNFVNNRLNEVQILKILSDSSDHQIREALRDLRSVLTTDSADRKMLEDIEQKIQRQVIQINTENLMDQQIGCALATYHTQCQTKLLRSFSEKQWCWILVDEILQNSQFTILFDMLHSQQLLQEESDQIRNTSLGFSQTDEDTEVYEQSTPRAQKFWQNLLPEQHFMIWASVSTVLQKQILISPKQQLIDSHHQASLWERIIFVKKSAEFWESLSDDEKIQGLKMMDHKLQRRLWNQICQEDQIQFLNFLEEKNQKSQFWSSLSRKLQDQALNLFLESQVVDLLASLDQQTLCLTMSMFKDKVLRDGNTLKDLLTNDDKKLAVATFNKFGKSSIDERSSERFIDDLVDVQYDGYKSTQNLQQDYIYEQVIENPLVENGLVTLGSFKNGIEYYNSKWDRYGKQTGEAEPTTAQTDGSSSSVQDDRPRILNPTLVRSEGKDYKEWRMDQVDADPVLNEVNISEIASYELIDGKTGYWCAESFTIQNRISKLYKGQDGHVFIFSRVSDEDSDKEAAATEGTNNIQLHVFKLLINVFKEELDIKLVEKYDQAVEQMYGKIDAQLLAEFRKEITNEYNHMRNNATDQQMLESANTCKFDLKNQQLRYTEWIQEVQNIIGGSQYCPIGSHGNNLDELEFQVFFEKYQGWIQRYSGGYRDDSRNVCSKFYKLYKRLSPEIDGVIKKDCSRAWLQIWFPLWCSLLIKDHSEESSHRIYTILQESHLGQELLKKEQVKKGEGELYMDQAPNLIKNEGNLLLVYTSATEAEGPGLFFYDLESSQTCAKVSKAELFLDCYPHQTDDGVTNIRYIIDDQVAERSVDFKQIQPHTQSAVNPQIYDVAQEDRSLISISHNFTRQCSKQDNWGGRYIEWGKDMQVFVYVNKKEDKENFRRSFQIIFKKKPGITTGCWDWGASYQSYEDSGITFKQTLMIEGAHFISYQANKTYFVAQNFGHIPTQNQIRLVEALQSEKELRTKETEFDHGMNSKENQRRVSLKVEKLNKFAIPIIQKDGKIMGLYFSQKNELSYFFHSKQKQTKIQLKQILQQKKLWNKTVVSYPFLFYTGLTPECREIVVANLADTTQPQKIIQLPDNMQLQFLIKSNVDDRIYFQAFVPNSGSRGDFEIVHRFPFKKNENYDHHEISIRRLKVNSCDAYAVESTKATHFNIICDSQSVISKLMHVYQDDTQLIIGHKQVNVLKEGNKITLPVRRSDLNNFYWVEESLALGFILRGVINISKINNKPQSMRIRDINLIDSTYISIVVERKIIDGEQFELISLLDKDLHLYTYIVNVDKQSFELFNEVSNLGQKLHIDAEWLIFNQKPQLTFEMYKQDYRLFSSETVGVIFKDFIVYYSIKNEAFSMVDTANPKFPLQQDTSGEIKEVRVQQTWTIDGTDFRFMQCKVKNTSKSYFVVYPAPESRQLDLFGFQGRKSNIQTTLISENLVLAKFLYKDIHQTWESEGQIQTEESYWSVIDQTGQIQSLPLMLESDSSIVYSEETDSGQIVIFKHRTEYKIVKFNLQGEVVFETTQDDEKIIQRTINMIQANSELSLMAKQQQNQQDLSSSNNQFSFSDVFLGPSQGKLYRLASIQTFGVGYDEVSEKNEDFSLFGALEIPNDSPSKTEGLDKITVLVFMCKTEAQYQHFQESVFQICRDSLCIFSPNTINKQIRIIKLAGKDTIQEMPNSFMMKDRKQSNTIEKGQSTEGKVTVYEKPQSIETVRQRLQREETLRVKKNIEKRQFSLKNSTQGQSAQFTKEDLEDCSPFIWTNFTEKTSIFKRKSNQRVINIQHIEKLINHDLKGEFNVKLDSLQLTTRKLSLKLTEDKDNKDQETRVSNFLQISFPQKVFLYDLSFKNPKESYCCFDIQHFVDSQNFVDLGLPKIWARLDETQWRQLTTSHQRNVFLAKDITKFEQTSEEKFVSLIKNFSFSDVQGLNWLSFRLEQKSEIQTTSFESMMVSYRGHNFYSMFSDQKEKLKKILEFIQDEIYCRQEESEEDEECINNPLIRRIYRVISMPNPKFSKFDQSKNNLSSELKSSLEPSQEKIDSNLAEQAVEEVQEGLKGYLVNFFRKEEKPSVVKIDIDTQDLAQYFTTALENCRLLDVNLRDLFMQLAINSDEFKISDFAADQEEMQQILESYSQTLNQFLTCQVNQTPITQKVTELKWPIEQMKTPLIFKQSSQAISTEQVQSEVNRKFKDERNWKVSQVCVKQLQTNWLVQNDGTFPKFSSVVQSCSSDRIFETEFMKNLVMGYWDRNSSIIKWYCFVPWVVYLTCTMILFTMILDKNREETLADNSNKTAQYVLSSVTLLLLLQQAYIEYLQLNEFSRKGLRDYFSNIANALDVIQLVTTAWIIVSNLQVGGFSHIEIQRVVASISSCILWMKAYDWLRLFDEPAFFVRLLSRTLYDIKDFTILFLVACAMFGSSIYILQYSVGTDLIESRTGVFMIDLVINQYILSLGNFEIITFEDHPHWYMVQFFTLAATFFTSVTMLNMLIAIMGNTFGEVIEKKAKEAMDTKLEIMSDFINIIAFFERDTTNFLFIVKTVVDDEEEEGESGEGAFNSLKKGMFNKIDKLEQNQTKIKNLQMSQAGKFKDLIQQNIEKAREDNKKVSQAAKEAIEAKMDSMVTKNEVIENKMEAMEEKMVRMEQNMDQKMDMILQEIKQNAFQKEMILDVISPSKVTKL